MRYFSIRQLLFAVALFTHISALAQDQTELVIDKFFLKISSDAYSSSSRSDASEILDFPRVNSILSYQDQVEIAPTFNSIARQDIDPNGLERIFTIRIASNQNILKVIGELNALPEVEYAEPMYIRELYETPNDPYFNQSWHHTTVGTPEAWDIQLGSDTVVVAIIDTGVDTDHPDLNDNLWNNPGEIAGNNIDDDNNGKVDDINGWDFTGDDADVNHEFGWHEYNAEDHGTHCAGIAAGVTNNSIGIAGASHYSKIMTCKIFPYLSDAASANAIIYAADNGADIISNSWGGGGSSATIQSAILYARNTMGSMVLFASGNDGSSSPHYPGANEGVVCVGASNSSDSRASFSNYGSWVDMCAPGTNIWSCTDPDNPAHNNLYEAWDGTSMATPLAAGIAALIKSQFPTMGIDDLEARLLDGDEVGNLQMGLRVNALKALSAFKISHTPLSNMPDSENPIRIVAETYGVGGNSLSLSLFYSVSGNDFNLVGMREGPVGRWTAPIPTPVIGSTIEYYIQAADTNENVLYHPESAPDLPHFFLVGTPASFNTLSYDDVETDQGWSLGIDGDNATTGNWIWADPVGTWEELEPVQPEDDHSEDGTLCFVTENAEFTGTNTGSGDVDGGRTTLESPIYNIPPDISPILSYWRWYSNDLGFNPGTDFWQVEIRDQNDVWISLENTLESQNAWTEKQFMIQHYFEDPTLIQLRFIAEDAGSGSLVEAAVDDIHIFYAGPSNFSAGDINLDALVNVQDVILIIEHILGQSTLTGDAVIAADFNTDNYVDIEDVISLINAILSIDGEL